MGTPGQYFDGKDYARGALMEINHAMSSLNMHPEPAEGYVFSEYADNGGRYISEIDANVRHAYEHLLQAYDYIHTAGQRRTYVLTITYEGICSTEAEKHHKPGDIFAVECFHGFSEDAYDWFGKKMALMWQSGKNILDPAYLEAYNYTRAYEAAKVWMHHFGYGVSIRCPQDEAEGYTT